MSGGTTTGILDPGLDAHDCLEPVEWPGDPALNWVFPRGNWLNRYLFEVGMTIDGEWCHDHLTVVARLDQWSTLTLDGEPLIDATELGGGLGFAYLPVADGTHEVEAPEGVEVEVTVVGYSHHGSYVFPGGMGLLEINPVD